METSRRQARFLLVDDDREFREFVSGLLQDAGFHVTEAEDGLAAKAKISCETFDAVISDVNMPQLGGFELLEFVQSFSAVPFIMMTGFSDLMDAQRAHKLGVQQFISKPFKKEEFIKAVDDCLQAIRRGAPEEVQNLDGEFCKLGIQELTSEAEARCDVFVRLSPSKYLKVIKKGALVEHDRLLAYQRRGLNFLFVRKEDYRFMVGFKAPLSPRQFAALNKNQKIQILIGAASAALEKCYVQGLDKDSFESARNVVESTIQIISEDQDLFDVLAILNQLPDIFFMHSLGVSLYSVLLAKNNGWTSPSLVFKVSLAGLLHDVGKKDLPRSLLEKPKKNFTEEERLLYETHPLAGKEILSAIPSVPDEVNVIVLHHHENVLGQGFPFKVKKALIHPLAPLVAVADVFCNLALKNARCPGLPAPDAIERMVPEINEGLDTGFLVSLMGLFKVPLPEGLSKRRRA